MKRLNLCSTISENEEDRLSRLPEDVISRILSRLPTKRAVQTSILSKRWRYKWTLVKALNFADISPIHGSNCSEFVDQALELRKACRLKLSGLRFFNADFPKSCISKWISVAVELNVCELVVLVTSPELPLSLFTCKTLTKLTLVVGVYDLDLIEFPSSVSLPCLKTLCFGRLTLPSVNAFKLIHGCPILKTLCLEGIWHNNNNDEYNFNIPTLKKLKLRKLRGKSVISKVVLNVPNLKYVFVSGRLSSLFVIEGLPPLVEVQVSFPGLFDHLWVELLKGISGTKTLRLSRPYNVPSGVPLPKFPNLKRLTLTDFFSSKRLLLVPEFLGSSSELRHLCIEETSETYEESRWIRPQAVPACMLKKLKTMEFTNCKGRKCDIEFLKYMLGNAEVLKTLTITCETLCQEAEMQLLARLLTSPRASRYCKVHFVGKWLDSTK